MRLVLSGGTGTLGRACLRALAEAGHEVTALARSGAPTASLGGLDVTWVRGDVLDTDSMVAAFEGADAVVNLATGCPVLCGPRHPVVWRRHDRLRSTGVTRVVEAARRAGVRRVVQESQSSLYAPGGEEWLAEHSPVEITPLTEPVAVGEAEVQGYASSANTGVVLRLGRVLGDDPRTRTWLRLAAHGRAVGTGHPDDWLHVLHSDDVARAVVAALVAPSGVYNVGAEPVRRHEVLEALVKVAGAEGAAYAGPLTRWWRGPRAGVEAHSRRVSSDHLTAQTGWRPSRPVFDPGWFQTGEPVAGPAPRTHRSLHHAVR